MEKDIGKVQKNDTTDIVVRVDDFGGRKGITVREFVTSENYTGFTKQGTRIPADKFLEFRELINSINLDDLKEESKEEGQEKLDEVKSEEKTGGENKEESQEDKVETEVEEIEEVEI